MTWREIMQEHEFCNKIKVGGDHQPEEYVISNYQKPLLKDLVLKE